MVHGILADANCEGHFQVLLRVLHDEERREFWHHLNLAVLGIEDLGLAPDASDSEVWERCQQRDVILVTANRNADVPDSLEATIQSRNTPDSLPVLILANVERIRRGRQVPDGLRSAAAAHDVRGQATGRRLRLKHRPKGFKHE